MNDRNQAKVTDFFPVVQRSFAETSKAIKVCVTIYNLYMDHSVF